MNSIFKTAKNSILSILLTSYCILKDCLLLYCLLLTISATAQLFPVQVNQSIIPPYDTNLNSYATSTNVKLRLYLSLTDVNVSNRQVRLKLKINGQGINIESNNFVAGAPLIFLNGGSQQQFTNIDLTPYFQFSNLTGINSRQYNQPLPDGSYKICWEVYDFLTNQRISDPNMGCSSIFLLLNDPPILNLPNRGDQLTDVQPTNIIFQWTPRHANANNVSYDFELRELWDNQIDPQAGFLVSPPYYTETTFSTTLLYNISKPQLIPGRSYAWRVRAKSTTGLSENAVFKNNGYSEIFYFTYTNECFPPTFTLAEPLSKGKVKITWQTHPDHNKYHIQYKRADVADAEWFEVFSYNNQAQIANLQDGITYDFRVGGTCHELTDFNQAYSYSSINQFTTPTADETVSYSCGIVPEIEISNTTPLANIGVNETFTAGDFPITVKQIEGANGMFSGTGFIVVPYLTDTKIAVIFSGIKINTDYQLFDGIIKTTYDPTWSSVEDVGDLFNGNDGQVNTNEVNFPIGEILIDPNGDILVVSQDGATVIELPGGEDYIIADNGDPNANPPVPPKTYHVDEEGNITDMGETAEGGNSTTENTDGVNNSGEATDLTANDVTVTFTPSLATNTMATVYGFDAYNPKYPVTENLYKKLGSNYYIPYKAVAKGQDDYIVANLNINDTKISPQEIIFKTKDGLALTKVDSTATSYTLKLTGTFSDAEVETQAVLKQGDKYKVAGAFIQYQATPKNTAIVLVNTANTNTQNIVKNLKAIYQQSMVNLNVSVINDFNINAHVPGTTIESGESGFLANYTSQQQNINNAIKSRPDYNQSAYYIILTNKKPSTVGEKGLMPIGRQFGYIYDNTSKTIAHEIGHGAFKLKHPFSKFSYGWQKDATNWLLDYPNTAEHLPFTHWKNIHNPTLRIGIFDADDEGESTVLSEIPILFKNPNHPSFTFLTMDGGFITLPVSVKDVEFTTGLDYLDGFVDYPVGALLGFTINSIRYTAKIERNTRLNEIILKLNGQSESVSSDTNTLSFDDFTYDFKGYYTIGTDEIIKGEGIKKYYGELITYLPNSFDKTLAQFHIDGLVYSEPSLFNILHTDDYNKLVFENKTHYGESYKYKSNSPFREQHELIQELVSKVLHVTIDSPKYPILIKYAELYNSNPEIFKNFFNEKYKSLDFQTLFNNSSIEKLKEDYINIIIYFTQARKGLLEEFIKYCDNEVYEAISAYGASSYIDVSNRKLLAVTKKLSSEQISEISIEYRIKGISKLLVGIKTDNYGDLDLEYQNQIFRLLFFIIENQKQDLFNFLTESDHKYKQFWDFANILDEEYLAGFMDLYTTLVNKFGSAEDRIIIYKELKQKDDSWTKLGDDFGNKTEQVLSGSIANLTIFENDNFTDAVTRLEQQKEIVKYFRENPSFLHYAFETMDNLSEVTPLTNFINTITLWDYKTESNTLRDIDALKNKYDSIDWVSETFTELPNIDDIGYIPFTRASWVKDNLSLFSFETEYLSTDKIDITLKIKNRTFISREYNPLEYVALHIIEDFKAAGYQFKKGELYNVPAIYLHWLDNDIDRVQNLAAFRVAGSVLSIALAPVTFGSSTVLIGMNIVFASADIYITVNRDELEDAGLKQELEMWDATYALYSLQFLPGAIKSVASGGKAFLNFTESVNGSIKFRNLLLNKDNLESAVTAFKNINNTENQIELIVKIDNLINAIKNVQGSGFNSVSKLITYRSLLEFRAKLFLEFSKGSSRNIELILEASQTVFKPSLVLKEGTNFVNLGKIELGLNNKLTIFDSSRWLPSNVTSTTLIGRLNNIEIVKNGVADIKIVEIVEDVSKPGEFYLNLSPNVDITNKIYKEVNFNQFISSVSDFAKSENTAIAKKAFELWGENKWDELYDLFNPITGKKINGGWPPFSGFKANPEVFVGNKILEKFPDLVFDRFQTLDRLGNPQPNLSGGFASPVIKGKYDINLPYTYNSRALMDAIGDGVYYIRFKVKETKGLEFKVGEAMPWKTKKGVVVQGEAIQIQTNIRFNDPTFKEGIHYQVLQKSVKEGTGWKHIIDDFSKQLDEFKFCN